jgi:hypothetical protein
MRKRLKLHQRIKAYKLQTQVFVVIVMFIIFILSLFAYQIPTLRENSIISNLLLALFTSLLVTIFTLMADIIVSYQNRKNEEFFDDLHLFGIKHLHRDKKEALISLLSTCNRIIWISGYRLILTCELKKDIYESIMRGADIKAVICPPWSDAFKMVYGNNEKVIDNYLKVFSAINKARKETGKSETQIEVLFVDKPIFSDTYRIDQNLITGPYMHNRDPEFNRLMAKDFFSYNIERKSDLHNIVNAEYETLYSEAKLRLNWAKFEIINKEIETSDLCESEKIDSFLSACEEVEVIKMTSELKTEIQL